MWSTLFVLEIEKQNTYSLLAGVDINTQQSFEALSERAVAVVVDPIQSVKGKVPEFKTHLVKNVHTYAWEKLLFISGIIIKL